MDMHFLLIEWFRMQTEQNKVSVVHHLYKVNKNVKFP